MAKYFDLSEDLEAYFTRAFSTAGLERVVNLRVIGCENQKTVYTPPKKVTGVYNFLTKEDVVITVNEQIFEMLEEQHRVIIAEEAIAHVGYDFEKDKLLIAKPDFYAFSGQITKYTYSEVKRCKDVLNALYSQKEDSEEEVRV
jgi:hypothetical protein